MRPLYKALLKLEGKGTPSLEQAVEESKRWVGEILRKEKSQIDLKNFEEGMSEKDGNLQVITANAEEEEKKYFGMSLSCPDIGAQNFIWETAITVVKDKDNPPTAEVTLSNGWLGGLVKERISRVFIPGVVRYFIDTFGATDGINPFSQDYFNIRMNNIKKLVNSIKDKNRKLPLVFISCDNFTDRPIANPEYIGRNLTGIAHVCVTESRFPSIKMQDLMGRMTSCYDGAVRIYWPITGETDQYHPIWLREEARDKNLHIELFKIIAQHSVARESLITLDKILNINLKQKTKTLHENEEFYKLAELYAKENDKLLAKTAQLELENTQLSKEKGLLEQKATALQHALNAKGSSSAHSEIILAEGIKSVSEAVEIFKNTYLAGRPSSETGIEILARAERSADSSAYERPWEIIKALDWLSTTYRRIRLGVGEGENLEESCRERTGLQYKNRQQQSTMGQFKEDYYTEWNGKKICLEEHLARGKSTNSKDAIRIAFYFDEPSKTVVVGYIGVHQANRKSN